jgi:cob(I)alamin adenosyltransferase
MIHLYTGSGKGKTTAALGLSLRASGAGMRVFFCQFLKRGSFSEIKALRGLKGITVCQFGSGCFVRRTPTAGDKDAARKGLERARKAVTEGAYDLVVLDEICAAITCKLVSAREVNGLLAAAPQKVEIVLTGRNAPRSVCARADLISRITDARHYYHRGVKARRGIEF